MIKGSIYKITNRINSKVYVGQTIQKPERRLKGHFDDAFNDSRYSTTSKIHNAIRKYGRDAFEFEVLVKNVPANLLDDLETNAIAMEDGYTKGYNTLEYGNSNRGAVWSNESKKKHSDGMVGEGNHFYGKKHSKKSIEKIRIARNNRVMDNSGLKNPTARIANIYENGTNSLIAAGVCITEWCRGSIYKSRNLRQTAQTYENLDYKYPAFQHKGIYALYV